MTQLNDITGILDEYAFAKQSLGDVAYCSIALSEESTEALEKSLSPNLLLQGLNIESGKILGSVKKWIRDDNNFPQQITPERRLQILTETGDVLFYWIYLIKALNSTPEEVLQILINKISSRKERGTQSGEGDNR